MGGCGPIPWQAIDAYARRHEVGDLDAFERFLRLIRAQDRIYLADVAARMKKPGSK